MKLYRPSHLLPALLLLTLASASETRRKRALRIFSAPPDSNQVYRGLNFPKHIDHVAQGGTIGLEYDARRLAGPVGSVWRRVKKFFRGDYKRDWNKILEQKTEKPWGKPVVGTAAPWEDPTVEPTEVIVKDDRDLIAEDRDGDEDFIINELINPRKNGNNVGDFREDELEKEWEHVRG